MQAAYRRERRILGSCLAVVVILSWLYLLTMARDMSSMDMTGMTGMAMDNAPAMVLPELLSLYLMWIVMMVAMMLPSVTPMTLVFLSINQRRQVSGRATVPTWLFIAGYLITWVCFALAATMTQWALRATTLFSADMAIANSALSAAILIGAGLYQLSSLKYKCLDLCRSPLSFLMSRWREGHLGAVRMGIEHGVYCVGCCWLLMALLFVAGVMNLMWVFLITVFVILEKLLPNGLFVSRLGGGILIGIGLMLGTGAF